MNVRIFLVILCLASLSACNKPTYPKETLEECVLKLCQDEYHLTNVKTKLIGKTLGVYIPLEGLVDPDLKLNQKAGEKIEDVALSIHRVTTSTDSPVQFYVLTARDTKFQGGEFILTGFVYDVIRVRLFDISRGEYFQRILRDFRFNPSIAGQERIKELINALNQDQEWIQPVKPTFYPVYTIGKRGTQHMDISEIQSKEISDHEVLLYVKTMESYEVAPGFEVYTAIFPPGFKNEYLFLIDLAMFQNPLREIVTKYFYANNEIRQRNLENTFNQYKDVGLIDIDGFPKRELNLEWFLSQQISRRIKSLVEEDKKLKKKFSYQSSTGMCENGIFHFTFNILPNDQSQYDEKLIYTKIFRLVGIVLHRYDFENYKGVELIDLRPGIEKRNLSKDELEKFRKGRLKLF